MINRHCERCGAYVQKSYYKLCNYCYKKEIAENKNSTIIPNKFLNQKELSEINFYENTIAILREELAISNNSILELKNTIQDLKLKLFFIKTGSYYYEKDIKTGDVKYYDEEQLLHREDGPAIEWANGNKQYYIWQH